jgi:hypothetical protein
MKSKSLIPLVLLAAVATACETAFAQGVAGVVVTNHIVDPGPQIVVGNAATPVPIDLDPNGMPWFKNVGDPQFNAPGPGIVDMFETIVNVGNEPWTDWHELLLPAPSGLPPHFWTNVVTLTVNGNPIGFTATGLNSQALDLFNFTQPVLPGDVFGIHKQLHTSGTAGVSGAFLRIQEYPTGVPEPGTLALVAVSSSAMLMVRRRR